MGRFVGSHVRRLEDPRLLQGQGGYLDDLALPGLGHLVFLRSPHAHAEVRALDAAPARAVPGVLAVLTAADLAGLAPKPLVGPPGMRRPPHTPLATDAVRYVGQPVAAIVADAPARARDGADAVAVEYAPRPAVTDAEAALAAGALAYEHRWAHGDVEAAFRQAARVVRLRTAHPRLAPLPLEPRGCAAQYIGGQLTVWTSTQMPHRVKADLAATLGIAEHRIRVIAPDVGGGFGAKGGLYDDELVVVAAAVRLGRPVKWVETRSESFLATMHGRGQTLDGELAVGADGAFLALRVTGLADLGAAPETFSALPPLLASRLVTGAYRIPAAEVTRARRLHATRRRPARTAGRGARRRSYLIERLADLAAVELGLDPVEIRRRNFVPPDAFPYRAPSGLLYDCGRYALTLDRALELAGYAALRAEQAAARREGRYLGIGLSAFVETAGTGPSRQMAMQGWEYGAVRVEPSGTATVLTGTSPHGQGLATTFAQIVADALGIEMEDVTVLHGDTAVVPAGFGTVGSRGACVGGSAVYLAAQAVRDKARRLAAHLLEAAPDDVVFEDGRLSVRGVPGRALAFREVAREAYRASRLPAGMEPGLEGSCYFDPPEFTVPFGVYVAVVEVAPDTGAVRLRRFVGVDDVGTVLSPVLLEGQLHGGIAQGIAQALCEEVVYDASGQCLTGSLMDYAAPKADDLPSFELDRTVTPTPVNPLGAKGAGEAGSVGAPAAIVNAVVDALAPLGIRDLAMPLRPERVWAAIRAATAS